MSTTKQTPEDRDQVELMAKLRRVQSPWRRLLITMVVNGLYCLALLLSRLEKLFPFDPTIYKLTRGLGGPLRP